MKRLLGRATRRLRPVTLAKAMRAARVMLGDPGVVAAGWRLHRSTGHVIPTIALKLAVRPFRPFLCAGWTPRQKFERMADHYRIAARLGGAMLSTGGPPRSIGAFAIAGHRYRLTLDESEPMMVEGLCMLSLMEGGSRLFSISFILAEVDGQPTLLVGGIQGGIGASPMVLDRYRRMTKEAHGLRPRDLMIELLRVFARAIGMRAIFCIAEGRGYQFDPYHGRHPIRVARMDYDLIWSDRGGRRRCDDWFDLPLHAVRRTPSQVALNKKRSLYLRRYAMLDDMEPGLFGQIRAAIDQPV